MTSLETKREHEHIQPIELKAGDILRVSGIPFKLLNDALLDNVAQIKGRLKRNSDGTLEYM